VNSEEPLFVGLPASNLQFHIYRSRAHLGFFLTWSQALTILSHPWKQQYCFLKLLSHLYDYCTVIWKVPITIWLLFDHLIIYHCFFLFLCCFIWVPIQANSLIYWLFCEILLAHFLTTNKTRSFKIPIHIKTRTKCTTHQTSKSISANCTWPKKPLPLHFISSKNGNLNLSSEKILINPPKTLTPKQNPISHLLYNNKTEETNPFF